MNSQCPVCVKPGECKGYPHLWSRLREDPARWMKVHDQMNGITESVGTDDMERAAALIAQEYPDGVKLTGVPIGRKCCG